MQQKDGTLLGTKGSQYGLQLRAPPGKNLKPSALAAAAAAPRQGNLFGVDSDEEEDIGTQVAKQAEKKRAAAKVQKQYEEALTQDASVFDYDGVYDSMQAAQAAPRQAEKIQRQSRYIAQLKEQAEKRKREEDISYERRLLKERKAEDHLFEGKEKFVTGAYRKKLEEEAKWKEEEKKREAEEEANDVRKVGHMGQFYNNLFTKNVAFGGAAASATPAITAVATSPTAADTAATAAGSSKAAKAAADGEGGADGEGEVMADDDAPVTAMGKQPQLDKYEELRLEAEKAIRRKQAQAASRQPPTQPSDAAAGAKETGTSGRQVQEQASARDADRKGDDATAGAAATEAGSAAEEAAKKAAADAALAAASKRRNDEAGVQSARERYLQRKAQKG